MPESSAENHTMLSTVLIDEEETKKETLQSNDAEDDSSMSENKTLPNSASLPAAANASLQSAFRIAKPRT